MEVLNGTESFLWVRASLLHHLSHLIGCPSNSDISEVLAWHMARIWVLISRVGMLVSRSIGFVLSALKVVIGETDNVPPTEPEFVPCIPARCKSNQRAD